MKKLLAILLTCLVSAQASADADSESESDLIINSLLNIQSKKFIEKNEEGEEFYDSLAEYHAMSDIYIKYSNFDNLGKDLSRDDLKKLLFIAFIARTNRAAATSQAFSSDLMVVYENNVTTFVEILSELKFLAPTACHYLNRYFGFEDQNAEKKEGWLKANESILLEGLGPKEGEACLSYFN